MAKEEMLDIYNSVGTPLGQKLRSLVHRDGDWHKTFHCWIIYKNEFGKDFVILQKRSERKKSWPGYVDISAAGHLESGETINDGLRELKEELGVDTRMENLVPLGTRICVEDFIPGVLNHEFQSVFFLIENRHLRMFKLQGEELSGILAVPIDDLIELFSGKVKQVVSDGIILDCNLTYVDFTYTITLDHFIPTLDNYYFKIMLLAKRALKGERQLLI